MSPQKISDAEAGTKRYLQVYDHYKSLILSGALPPDTRMPSIRKCSIELQYSRTTIETAYLLLAAEGYLYAKPQSGYYVTEIASKPLPHESIRQILPPVRYDFTTSGSANVSETLEIWRRYVKNALRQEDRLSSYGEPQGEAELREALAEYLKAHRNIICSPDSIVIGAGVQTLLNLLCPLLSGKQTVSFPDTSFRQGLTIFRNYRFDIHIKDKDADVIYVMPAHMTPWGSIMPVRRRLELIRHRKERGSLIIEDDYENDFVYLQKPTPSLTALSGGENIVYIGTFSRLLLPSVRLSYMVLPPSLLSAYREAASCYNQTASKTEQIALAQYIRDGHLNSRIRKLRKIYSSRMRTLSDAIETCFGPECSIRYGDSGFTLALTICSMESPEALRDRCMQAGIRIRIQSGSQPDTLLLLLSCASIEKEQLLPGCESLFRCCFPGLHSQPAD